MKIIVGLGNPGKKYDRTRHNAGFLVADEIARNLRIEISQEKYSACFGKGRIGSEDTVLAKPLTFMNDSGRAVGALLRETYSTVADLIVIHDELDIPFGTVRIKIGGGHGGHNGLRSIIEVIGSSDFVRVRVGIGRPVLGMDAAAYVLGPFSTEERTLLPDVLRRAADAASAIVHDGPTSAMNFFNQK
jgi:PTH1 family peptidyl-tRNA hydrolase